MKKMISFILCAQLTGCISVHGPTKSGQQDQETSSAESALPTSAAEANAVFIGNRKPDETHTAIARFFQQKALRPEIDHPGLGIVAASGKEDALADLLLDCSALKQTQNLTKQYRLVAQSWRAGEGVHVSVQVTGDASLITADGNDKVKPVECPSTGLFEKDMLEALRK